jgi:hypothetical protein
MTRCARPGKRVMKPTKLYTIFSRLNILTNAKQIFAFVLTVTCFSVGYVTPVLDNVAAGQVSVSQSSNTTVVNQGSQQAQ